MQPKLITNVRTNGNGERVVRSSPWSGIPFLLIGLTFGLVGFGFAFTVTVMSPDDFYHPEAIAFLGWAFAINYLACALIFLDRGMPRRLVISPYERKVSLKGGFLPSHGGPLAIPYEQIEGIQVSKCGRSKYSVSLSTPGAWWMKPLAVSKNETSALAYASELAKSVRLPVVAADPGISPRTWTAREKTSLSENRFAIAAIVTALIATAVLPGLSAVPTSVTFVRDLSARHYGLAQTMCSDAGGGISVSQVEQYVRSVSPRGLIVAVPIWSTAITRDGHPAYAKVRYHCLSGCSDFSVGLQMTNGWHVLRMYRN